MLGFNSSDELLTDSQACSFAAMKYIYILYIKKNIQTQNMSANCPSYSLVVWLKIELASVR